MKTTTSMIRTIGIAKAFLLLSLAFLFPAQNSKACNLSSYQLDSVVLVGIDYRIYTTVCIGGGLTGGVKGADGPTNTFAFAFYTPGASPLNILAFGPPSVVGDSTGCFMNGVDVGPQGPPYNSQGTIGYIDPGCINAFTCISSTAACGNVHSQCIQVDFIVDVLPDSIRVFSVEGSGLALGGCYAYPDMKLDFSALPVVWGDLRAVARDGENLIQWSTISEVNNDRFEIQRSEYGITYETIGTVASAGSGDQNRKYEFSDLLPPPGETYYRIVQVDREGNREISTAVSVNQGIAKDFFITDLSPNPFTDQLKIGIMSGNSLPMTLRVLGIHGEMIIQQEIKPYWGKSTLDLDLSDVPAGIYFLEVSQYGAKHIRKIIKR